MWISLPSPNVTAKDHNKIKPIFWHSVYIYIYIYILLLTRDAVILASCFVLVNPRYT